MRYPVGVGKSGKQWAGTAEIEGKYRYPAWSPPDEVRRDHPSIPDVIPGGSPENPMGGCGDDAIGRRRNMRFTAPTGLIRLAVSYPMAASAC